MPAKKTTIQESKPVVDMVEDLPEAVIPPRPGITEIEGDELPPDTPFVVNADPESFGDVIQPIYDLDDEFKFEDLRHKLKVSFTGGGDRYSSSMFIRHELRTIPERFVTLF